MPSIIKTINIFNDGDNPIYGESVVSVSLEDECGGCFLVLEQCNDETHAKMRLTLEEIESIIVAAKQLMEQPACQTA
jgi:hypothetical protein